jgi:hypothetical protein
MSNRSEVLGQALRILIAPSQRLPDDFVFVRTREIPQPPLARSLVDSSARRATRSKFPPIQRPEPQVVLFTVEYNY